MTYPFQVTFDCHDIEAMAQFWAVALNYSRQEPPNGFSSWAELPRIGASLVTVFDGDDGWHIAMLDPEGNEFCIQ